MHSNSSAQDDRSYSKTRSPVSNFKEMSLNKSMSSNSKKIRLEEAIIRANTSESSKSA
jgi:hypothetical protein